MHSAHRTSACTPDFDQHADRRAISQDMEKQNKGPCTPSLTSSYAFSYSSSFPLKMLATDAKTLKSNLVHIVFIVYCRTKVSEAVCKRD